MSVSREPRNTLGRPATKLFRTHDEQSWFYSPVVKWRENNLTWLLSLSLVTPYEAAYPYLAQFQGKEG